MALVLFALPQLFKHGLPLTCLQMDYQSAKRVTDAGVCCMVLKVKKKESSHQSLVFFFTLCTQLLGEIVVKDPEIYNENGLDKCKKMFIFRKA